MRRESVQQYRIIHNESAELLTRELNDILYELKDKRPTVTFEGMIARVCWTEDELIKEGLADEYEEKGVRLTCQDCPYFEPILKMDGSLDKRIKWGNCPYAHYGRTDRNSSACERLFEAINSGEVRLCLAE